MTAFNTTQTDTHTLASLRIDDVEYLSTLCEVHVSHEVDNEGYEFTLVELITAEIPWRDERTDFEGGEPMADIEIDGHVSTLDVATVLVRVVRDDIPEGVYLSRANSYGQVA